MTFPPCEIRVAGPEDAALLSELSARAFRDAYGTNSDPAHIEAHIADNFAEAHWRTHARNDCIVVFLAERDARAIGYAALRLASPTDCIADRSPAELWRIYLIADAIGSGVGSALMRACLAEARRRGARTMWLGVWEDNHRAVRFYEAWGFRRRGTHSFVFGGTPYDDLVMARPLVHDARVRLLGPGDAQLLLRAAPGVFDRSVDPARTHEFLQDARHHIAVGLDADGTVIAFATGVRYIRPDAPAEMWITDVSVAPDHRGCGVGRDVVHALLGCARALGCTRAWSLTHPRHAAAIGAFTSAGGVREPESSATITFDLEPGKP